jgi:DNA-directed RNA polymerase subunit RPC12/RpoP
MAFLVKKALGEARKMERVEIQEALKNRVIEENWLVRDERQDFWYSVGKLVGKVSSQPVNFACETCRRTLTARRIDIGLPVVCTHCGAQVMVTDPLLIERRERDEQILINLKNRAVISGLALAAGLLVTVSSFIFRADSGVWIVWWVVWWGPLAFGLGTFAVGFPQYLSLKRRLRNDKTGNVAQE